MTTSPLALTEFLLARIAEDEAAALAATPGPWRRVSSEWGNGSKAAHVSEADYRFCLVVTHTTNDSALDTTDHIARHDPARVLAQCEALRRIVSGLDPNDPIEPAAATCAYWVLRLLALPYADHPDYREEWKP